MGESRGRLRDFEGFPEPAFLIPFLTEGPPSPLKTVQESYCAVSPWWGVLFFFFFYNQLNVLLNCKYF